MKKKIIILVPNIGIGGQERMAVLTGKLLDSKCDVKIVIFNHENKEYETDTEIQLMNLPPLTNKVQKCVQLIRRIHKFNKIKKSFKPDYIISFGTTANYVNVLSNGIGEKIISYRGFDSLKKSFSLHLSCKLCDKVFCISQGMCDYLIKLYPNLKNKVQCIYNACDIEDIHNKIKFQNIEYTNKRMIISVGRLKPVKGFKHLLNAFKLVTDKEPNTYLTVIGGGEYDVELEKYTQNLGIKDKVCFLGSVENPFPYVYAADICVQTSISEGFMNVIVEALACGTPAISTDCQAGPREILSDNNSNMCVSDFELAKYGILVPPFESDDSNEPYKDKILANAILYLLNDEKKYNEYKKLSAECANRFSIDTYKDKIEQLLNL